MTALDGLLLLGLAVAFTVAIGIAHTAISRYLHRRRQVPAERYQDIHHCRIVDKEHTRT